MTLCLTLTALTVLPAAAGALSETFEWSGGAAAKKLAITNVSGDVRVAVAGDEIIVKATKTAADTDSLEKVTVEVHEKGDKVDVKVEYPHGRFRGADARVDFDVTVPESVAGLEVHAATGNLTAAGIADVAAEIATGEIKISGAHRRVKAAVAHGSIAVDNAGEATRRITASTVSGDLRVKASLPEAGADYDLSTVSGNVSLSLSGATDNYEIVASTVSGEVSSDLPLERHGRFVGGSYEGKAGAGTNSIRISAVSGSVRISAEPR
jgi:DUF4097 and DUF4098 domain-containing protein YvlB